MRDRRADLRLLSRIGFGLAFVFCPLVFFSVSRSTPSQTQASPQVGDPFHLPPDENPRYFPAGSFTIRPDKYDVEERSLARELRAMREPPLLDEGRKSSVPVFRLLKIPSQYWRRDAVRLVVEPDGTGVVTLKSLDERTGELVEDKTSEVTKPEAEEFSRLLQKAMFWSMPTHYLNLHYVVMDGEGWVLEGASNGEYHVVTRTSPEPGPFANLCSYIVHSLAGIGSTPKPMERIEAPPEIASLVPKDHSVRVLARTNLSSEGETLVAYERDRALDKEPRVIFVRQGKIVQELRGLANGCYTAGFVEFALDSKNRAAALAFRCAGDGSGSLFVILGARGQAYEIILRQESVLGRMMIYPAKLHVPRGKKRAATLMIQAAHPELDVGESCVYCPHRYGEVEFAWHKGSFRSVLEKTWPIAHDPYDITAQALAVAGQSRGQ